MIFLFLVLFTGTGAYSEVELGIFTGITHSYISGKGRYHKQLVINPSIALVATGILNEKLSFSTGLGINANGGKHEMKPSSYSVPRS